MQNNRPNEEKSIYEQTRRLVNNLPVSPAMYDGTYPAHETFTTTLVSESSVSELNFSSESPDSDSNDHFQTVEPIVELPSTPLKDGSHQPEDCMQTLSPSTIGAALEKSGTVLMQRSLNNRLAKQLEQMHTLMSNEDELVILKQNSIRTMASHPAFTQDMLRDFMEHSETMFNLVHETNGNSAQFVIGIEETESSDPDVPGCSQRPIRRSFARTIANEEQAENEFVGCFSKDNDMVLYKRTMPESPINDGNDRESIDALIAHHAQCLVEADKVTSPTVHVRQGNDDNMLALLTFSEKSSAVLKTTSAMAEGVTSEDELNKAILNTYRQLVAEPDEMISMKTQSAISPGLQQRVSHAPVHRHYLRPGVMNNLSNATSSFGLSNDSTTVPMVVQGSSKNWIKCPRMQQATEIVINLRLLLEEYILRNISVTGTVLKFVSHVLSKVMHCAREEVGDEFRSLCLVAKIKQVLSELLMPHCLEDPVQIVNQLRHTIEEIQAYPLQTQTLTGGEDAWKRLHQVLEKLSCELDHDVENPEHFIEALQYGIRRVDESCPVLDVGQEKKVVTIDPITPVESGSSVFPASSSILQIDQYEAPSVSFCKPYSCFFEHTIISIWAVLVWIMNQMNSFWEFLNAPPPPLLAEPAPSVSFHRSVLYNENSTHQQHRNDGDLINQARNLLQIALEKSAEMENAPATEEADRSVKSRSLEMFTQLLHDAGSIELKHSISRHNIHLQLHTSVSGMLEQREADDYLTMTGNIRDHDANVAVFFDARIIDLESLGKVESVMECVTRIRRLSDDVENSEILSEETVVQPAAGREQVEDEQVVSSLIEEMVYKEVFPAISTTGAEQLLREIKHCLQDLLSPVTSAVHKLCDQFTSDVVEKVHEDAPKINEQVTYEEDIERCSDQSCLVCYEPITTTDKTNEIETDDVSSPALQQSSMAEALQELLAQFRVTNERLELIDSDIGAIRNEVQQLISVQQQQQQLVPEGTKPSHSKGRRWQRKSITQTFRKSYNTAITQCLIQQQRTAFGQGVVGSYCPVEIYSCHPVPPDVLVVHWQVLDESVLHCVAGFEIFVDNKLRSVCYSNKRRTTLVGDIDLTKQHQIALHITPRAELGAACAKTTLWAPAFFLYHT
uniref:Uncharacterized protein n=1 Tax=Anopheles christyi TaxID=43041 RepID=A0A182JX53_9DIPT